jgi:hypothetical protein
MSRDTRILWHELLGKALADVLIGLPYHVSTEEELALRSQRLDVLIIEQGRVQTQPKGTIARPPNESPDERPDGLEDLAAHNLLSYKAAGESFDAWALEELNSHYVTYRKLASIRALRHLPAGDDTPLNEPRKAYPLLPAEDFRCYAIATRFPRKLIKQLPAGSCQSTEKAGIYRLTSGTRDVRLVVLNDLEVHPRNAPWGLFSSNDAHRHAALAQYRPRSEVGTHLHNQMSHHILGEGNMAYTYEDMQREAREWLKSYLLQLAPKERLEGLDPDDVLKRFDPETRLKGLDPDLIEAWLNKQRRDH